MAPEEADKGRLWEAETEALDNGKAYLIDPKSNSEHATYAQKKHTHITLLPKLRSCKNTTIIGNNYGQRAYSPFNDRD